MKKFAFIVSLWTLLVGGVFAITKEDCYGLLATVNGAPITVYDVANECAWPEARLPLMFQGEELRKAVAKLRQETCEKIIERELVFDEFKEKGFQLPRSYIEENLDRLMTAFRISDRAELSALLNSHGETLDEFKLDTYKRVATDALLYDYCYRGTYITPKELTEYYQRRQAEFASPETISIDVLVLKTDGSRSDNLEALVAHLQKKLVGSDAAIFKDAVVLYSEGANVENGGNIGWIDKKNLRDDFRAALKTIEKGGVYGPIKAPEAYYFLRVADIRSGAARSFQDVKEEIREKLLKEKRESVYREFVDNLKKKAVIKRYY